MRLIFIPIALSIVILSIQINKPFIGHHDFMGAFMGKVAKNYLEYGPINLKFGQATGFITNGVKNHHSFQLSYLPLLPLLISLSYLIFGVSEWSTRLVPAIASVIGVIFLFLIIDKIWNRWKALLTSILYILTPMFIYFGKLPAPEPLILGAGLASFYWYLNWLDEKSNKNLILITLTLSIGTLSGWPIIYMGILILVHSILIKQFNFKLVFPIITMFLIISLQFVHSYILTGSFLPAFLVETIRSRVNQSNFSFGGLDFSYTTYIRQEISWLQAYFTRTLIILSVIGMISVVLKPVRFKIITLLIFLIAGLAHPILFSRYVFVHDFLNIYLLPFWAISGMLGVTFLINQSSRVLKNKILIYLGIGLIISTFVLERIDFSKALLATSMNKQGMDMANYINILQDNPNEVVLVSPRFASFYGMFLGFYSNYYFATLAEKDLKQRNINQYKYIIMLDEDISDQKFYKTLISQFKSTKKDGITTISTK